MVVWQIETVDDVSQQVRVDERNAFKPQQALECREISKRLRDKLRDFDSHGSGVYGTGKNSYDPCYATPFSCTMLTSLCLQYVHRYVSG